MRERNQFRASRTVLTKVGERQFHGHHLGKCFSVDIAGAEFSDHLKMFPRTVPFIFFEVVLRIDIVETSHDGISHVLGNYGSGRHGCTY